MMAQTAWKVLGVDGHSHHDAEGNTMNHYQQAIQNMTGCTEDEAREAEEVMRHDIFHSTLDWQPRALFQKAARVAVAYLRGERTTVALTRRTR